MAEVISVDITPGETPAKTATDTTAETTQETPKGTEGTTQDSTAQTEQTPGVAQAGDQKPTEGGTAETKQETANVDLDSAAEEFITNGEISADSLKALEAKGFTKTQAETYAAGIKAQADQAVAKLADRVGGAEQFSAMREWAKSGGLDATTLAAYDALMTSGNEAQMHLAIDGLAARFTAANGTEHGRVNGANLPRSDAPKAFQSSAEVTAAMKDPRYAKDPAYRAAVAARMDISDVVAIGL